MASSAQTPIVFGPVPRSAGLDRLDGLRARLAKDRLERRLLEGVDPLADPLLACRASQLAAPRCRAHLARGLERAISAAHPPRLGSFSSAIPVRRDEVLRAEPVLRGVVDRLRDGRPISPAGVARVRALLTDGWSILYVLSEAPGDLRRWAVDVLDELDHATR